MSAIEHHSSNVDAIDLARHIIDEYGADLAGSSDNALAAIMRRLAEGARRDGIDPSQENIWRGITRMRGPYLQALAPPAWSERSWSEFAYGVRATHAPNGFDPDLVTLLERIGFRRLYRFQEEGMSAVLEDRDVLITAATGRGKTESWLLPILQYIVRAKDGGVPDESALGTKALLVYPTKALSQDQLRRLIRYLIPINSSRPPHRRITVGILDGDTPNGSEPETLDYLTQAFRLFSCPVPPGERCQYCTAVDERNLIVKPPALGGGRYVLSLPEDDCAERVPLDFVRLTRLDMRTHPPDILITNPDILHLRLLNVNDHAWRSILIDNPRFVVLDEIHTYAGTLGAAVAWIIRRLRLARSQAGIEKPLRVVAASATVGNGPELFGRISGVPVTSVTQVREQPVPLAEIEAPKFATLPAVLFDRDWAGEPVEAWLSDKEIGEALGGAVTRDEPDAIDHSELLYRRIVDDGQTALTPMLRLARWLYLQARERPAVPEDLRERLAEAYPGIDSALLDCCFANALAVTTAAGLLESRAHLFSWPVDGYYLCVACGAAYLEPRGACGCGNRFVTRVVACADGDELSTEGWLCPICLTTYPFLATSEGQLIAFDPRQCDAGHEAINCVRVVWRPYGTCAACGELGKQGDPCPSCSATIPDGSGASGLDHYTLPWACGNCGSFQSDGVRIPKSCAKCGSHQLVLGAVAEVRVPWTCSVCQQDRMPGRPCPGADHVVAPGERELDRFSLMRPDGTLAEPKDFRKAVPCYHPYADYRIHRRYQPLVRSPANVGVTSAQIALRRIVAAGDGGALQKAKMLSFSDSQNDMEQLTRDFNDPELDTFIDQAIFAAVADGPRSFNEVIEAVRAVAPDGFSRRDRGQWLPDRILSRFVRGNYRGRPGPPTLARDGLGDLGWSEVPSDPDERSILVELLVYNGQQSRRMERDSRLPADRVTRALMSLEREGWIRRNNQYISLAPERLVVARVGRGWPILRDESEKHRFVLTARNQLDPVEKATLFAVAAEQRVSPDAPDYSRAARRIYSTPRPVLLEGRTYKGSTPKADRRKLEFQFARRSHPNFLSSGPAMEVGIDIGDLDCVLLYGTPPNINAYLQRIGRAGRRTKQSLVMSVSKRNPIDLYYYRDPLRLIASDPQPVPLQEHHERIVEVALTWAVLDWVAGQFVIPWTRNTDGDEPGVGTIGEPTRRDAAGHAGNVEILTWLRILREPTRRVSKRAMSVLSDLVVQHRHEVYDYLRALLGYPICRQCNHQGVRGASTCDRQGCGGALEPATVRFGPLIDEAIDRFAERLVRAPFSIADEYRAVSSQLRKQLDVVEDEIDEQDWAGGEDLERKRQQIETQLQLVLQLRQAAGRSTLWDNQERSSYARFGYSIRGFNDEVAVELVSGGIDQQKVEQSSRNVGAALREMAPGALTLQNDTEYVTLAVLPDLQATEALTRRLREVELPPARACRRCLQIVYPGADNRCPRCRRETEAVQVIVPGRARAYDRDQALGPDPRDSARRLFPSHAFPHGDAMTPLANTFVHGSLRILSFVPRTSARLVAASGNDLGRLDAGPLELLSTSDVIEASYETGQREGRPRFFELCGFPECGGVIVPGSTGTRGFCIIDPSHDTESNGVVQVAARTVTTGVRLTGLPGAAGHSLLHGLRAGLEQVSGVMVRGLGEHIEQDAYYIYDGDGGTGATELLLDPGNDYRYFQTALRVAAGLSECTCENGCPQCLYQFGCAWRNRPDTLSRLDLAALIASGLRVERVELDVTS